MKSKKSNTVRNRFFEEIQKALLLDLPQKFCFSSLLASYFNKMARCCAVITGEGIYGSLILHQVLFF
jgi:hypothetical protein